jgi:hypothetical protein
MVRLFTQMGCLVLTYVLWIATADSKKLAVRNAPDCYGAGNDTFSASVANVIACFNYLVSVGHTACPAAAGYSESWTCQAGDARVETWNAHGGSLFTPKQQSAWCVVVLFP